MVHPRPQIPQGESVAKHGTPRLIILSLVVKSDIKDVHDSLSVFSKIKSMDGNVSGRRINAKTVSHTLIISD